MKTVLKETKEMLEMMGIPYVERPRIAGIKGVHLEVTVDNGEVDIFFNSDGSLDHSYVSVDGEIID